MLEFAHALPGLRERAAEHLAADGLGRERVLACATRLLDRGFFRMGTEGYAEQNQTYGLATIQKRHVRLDGDLITFDYVAKSGKRRLPVGAGPARARGGGPAQAPRGGGPDLLAYKQGRAWVDVRSDDINDYIKEQTGGDFTAKDFRTWTATVLAAVAMASSFPQARSRTARARAISRAVKEVAHYLGNTPAVCRASYIDPRVFDRYRSGLTIAGALGAARGGRRARRAGPPGPGRGGRPRPDRGQARASPRAGPHRLTTATLAVVPGQRRASLCARKTRPRRLAPHVRVQAGRREPLGRREGGRPPPAGFRPGPGRALRPRHQAPAPERRRPPVRAGPAHRRRRQRADLPGGRERPAPGPGQGDPAPPGQGPPDPRRLHPGPAGREGPRAGAGAPGRGGPWGPRGRHRRPGPLPAQRGGRGHGRARGGRRRRVRAGHRRRPAGRPTSRPRRAR